MNESDQIVAFGMVAMLAIGFLLGIGATICKLSKPDPSFTSLRNTIEARRNETRD
jgi:adenine-specific DNA glycosylase